MDVKPKMDCMLLEYLIHDMIVSSEACQQMYLNKAFNQAVNDADSFSNRLCLV